MVRIEDIIIWILILAIIAIAIWLLSGSPTETNALISIALFIATSEILLWKKVFSIDKCAAVGFAKVKGKLNVIENKIDNIDRKLRK